MTTHMKKAQSGRSMIEMLGVLAIIGVLSAGGIAGYSMAMTSFRTNSLMDKIQMISTQARILYNGNYDGIDLGTMQNLGYITTKDIENPFGGTISVGKGANNGIFWLRTGTDLEGVPAEVCVKYLTAEWGGPGIFYQVNTGSTSDATRSEPVSLVSASQKCGTSGTKQMIWTFR